MSCVAAEHDATTDRLKRRPCVADPLGRHSAHIGPWAGGDGMLQGLDYQVRTFLLVTVIATTLAKLIS